MKKGDKEWLIFAETGKWISSLFASHCCPWFLPSRSSATATATAPAAIPSSSLDGTSDGLFVQLLDVQNALPERQRKKLWQSFSFFLSLSKEQLGNGD
jgi:hypothetical protein